MQGFHGCLISEECTKFINMVTLKNKTYELYSKDTLKLLNGIDKCFRIKLPNALKSVKQRFVALVTSRIL